MRWIVFALVLALLPSASWATDCDVLPAARSWGQWSVVRVLLADGKTGTGSSTKCTAQSIRSATTVPWDFYRFVAEEGDTCTSWTMTVRDYPVNSDTSQCRGSCDAHTLATLDKTATTSKTFNEPLGEAMDSNISAISCSGGVSVYLDFYYRDQGH